MKQIHNNESHSFAFTKKTSRSVIKKSFIISQNTGERRKHTVFPNGQILVINSETWQAGVVGAQDHGKNS
jgi:hypothetical protein